MTALPPTASSAAPPALPSGLHLPALITDAGEGATRRFVEFFTAHVRNPHTRRAYARAAYELLAWAEARGLALAALEPVHVAAYVEALGQRASVATVKQRLAAIRALFDFLVVGQVVPVRRPACAARRLPAGPGRRRRSSRRRPALSSRSRTRRRLAACATGR